MRVALTPDQATLRVSIDGAPPGSTATVLLGGRRCATHVLVATDSELTVDIRGCRSARAGEDVTVSVAPRGHPAEQWTVEAERLFAKVDEMMRGAVIATKIP